MRKKGFYLVLFAVESTDRAGKPNLKNQYFFA